MNYMERYEQWRSAGLPDDVNKELHSVRNDMEELKDILQEEIRYKISTRREEE